MKDGGLTHGGFYAHFESRDALLAAAVDQAGAESTENLNRAVAVAKPGEELMALVDTYLEDRHVTSAEHGLGCAIAAAGSEGPPQPGAVRRASPSRARGASRFGARTLPELGHPRA